MAGYVDRHAGSYIKSEGKTMIRKILVSTLWVTTWVILFFGGLACADTETLDETYDVRSGTRFEILNHNGSITIEGWDRSQINVHATKQTRWGGKLENVDIQVSAGTNFKVETLHLVKNPRVSVSYDVRVPLNVVVKHVRTSNGKIELEATHGDTDLETSNGKIEIKAAVGDIDAHTSSGAIEIQDVKGYITAHTSNGAIHVAGITGVSELETSNGHIETEVPLIGQNGLRVHTSNGAIVLHLAPDLNADLEVKTSNGKIALEDIEVVVGEISKNTLRGKIGRGGNKILCRTSNGSIVLKRLK